MQTRGGARAHLPTAWRRHCQQPAASVVGTAAFLQLHIMLTSL